MSNLTDDVKPAAKTSSVAGMKMVRKRSSNDTQGPGSVDEDVFRQSFIPSMSVSVSSSKELADIINRVKDTLGGNPEEWEKRVDALKIIRAVVAQGATQYDDFIPLLKNLETSVDTSLKDLRSTVVREACITVAYLSQELRNRFDRFAETILQTVISLMSNSAKIMATSGIVAMRFILENTCSPRLLPILSASLSSKSNVTRRCICEFMEIIFRAWPVNVLEKNMGLLQDALKRGISDADQEARFYSRRTFPLFVSKFPDQANTLLQNLDVQKRKLIEKDLISAGLNGSIAPMSSQSNISRPTRPVLGTSVIGSTTNRSRPPLTNQNEHNTVGRYVRQGSALSNYDNRGRNGRKLVSQSQPTSREVSPSRFTYLGCASTTTDHYNHLSNTRANANGLNSTDRGHTNNSSRIPRSECASRETSPTRSTTGVYPPSSYQHSGAGGFGYRKAPRGSISTMSECGDYGDTSGFGRRYSNQCNKTPFGSDDNFSETSSQCSERSISGFRRNSSTKITSNLKEIVVQLSGTQWSDRKDGLVNLQNYMRSGCTLSPEDIRRLTEIFSKMFSDSQSKVVTLFMDTLQLFIKDYNPSLRDWLYTLLIRLLFRQSSEALSSHQKAIQETLFVLRSHFPLNAQFTCCCRFIMDNSQTLNFRVKSCLLEYIRDLILMMSVDVLATPTNEVCGAIGKIILWSSEPKSADVRRLAARVVIKLFDLNASSFSSLLQNLPRQAQDRAQELLKAYQKTSTGSMQMVDGNHGSAWKPLSRTGSLRKYSLPVNTRHSMTRSVEQKRHLISPTPPDHYPQNMCSTQHSTEAENSEAINRLIRDATNGIHSLSVGFSGDSNGSRRSSLGSGPTSPLQYKSRTEQGQLLHDNVNVNCPPPGGVLRTMQPNNQQTPNPPHAFDNNTNNSSAMNNCYPISGSDTGFGMKQQNKTTSLINYDHSDAPKLKKPVIGYQTLKKIREMPPEDIMTEILQELSNHNERYEQRKTCMLKLIKLLRDGVINNWSEYFKPTLLILLETLGDDGPETRALALKVLQELVRSKSELFHDFAYLFVIKVLEACLDSEKAVVRAAEECASAVAQYLPQELCLNVLTPLINDCNLNINLPAVKMQTQVIQNSSPELVNEFVDAIIPGLIVACNHKESIIRKASVYCLVAIAVKIGDKIWNHLKSLPASKIRLLEIYIDRQYNLTTSEDSLPNRS